MSTNCGRQHDDTCTHALSSAPDTTRHALEILRWTFFADVYVKGGGRDLGRHRVIACRDIVGGGARVGVGEEGVGGRLVPLGHFLAVVKVVRQLVRGLGLGQEEHVHVVGPDRVHHLDHPAAGTQSMSASDTARRMRCSMRGVVPAREARLAATRKLRQHLASDTKRIGRQRSLPG